MKADAVKGHLDLLLLTIVEDGALHGYAVIEELRRRTDDALDLTEGTVYPALHRLERATLLTSSWDDTHARRRRVYAITPKGHRTAASKSEEWAAFLATVHRVLEGPSCPSLA
jgi:PadR family transcriptional regulator PadR